MWCRCRVRCWSIANVPLPFIKVLLMRSCILPRSGAPNAAGCTALPTFIEWPVSRIPSGIVESAFGSCISRTIVAPVLTQIRPAQVTVRLQLKRHGSAALPRVGPPSCCGLGSRRTFSSSLRALLQCRVIGCVRHKGKQVLLVILDFVDFGGPKLLFRDFPARS